MSIDFLLQKIKTLDKKDNRIVFVSGDFNIVHPGHLRLLKFASECGDILIVGINPDHSNGKQFSQQTRLEGVLANKYVDIAFLLEESLELTIKALKPLVIVKGKEYEHRFNPELEIVESYGGKLMFSSGEVGLSSLDLLHTELKKFGLSTIHKPVDFLISHDFKMNELADIVHMFQKIKVVVIGDLIIDEYIDCEPLGMSQEDPTIVVSPINSDKFIGGAGIVAAHASGLKANVSYLTVIADDENGDFAKDQLGNYGVKSIFLIDDTRPTTLKQRFRSRGKTLLRVNHLRQHEINIKIADQLFVEAARLIPDANLFIFSDFNYGVLPQDLVDRLVTECKHHGVIIAADSQSSSQFGDISRFNEMNLLTPTEREARIALRDYSSGLIVLADNLRLKSKANEIVLKLGIEGLIIHAHAHNNNNNKLVTDRLPAFNLAPKDVSGAGDSLLICTALSLATGANIWRSSYIGALAAAIQVSRLGNIPLTAEEILGELLN